MILGAVQPSYMPWIPFFKRMQMSDVFVYLDDVEYSKNSFHNRNRIKTPNGALLLSVPVSYKGHSKCNICSMPIDQSSNWRNKHWKAIEINYSKAPYFSDLAELLEPFYRTNWEFLSDANITLAEVFRDYLGISAPTYTSSKLGFPEQGNDKLMRMCHYLGASSFLVKPNTESYHPKEVFTAQNVDFAYFNYVFEPYPQLYGDFIPGLSILDYAMNCGRDSMKERQNENR